MNIKIISPHIDDAIFSLWGFIYLLSNKHKIDVVNIFSTSNFIYWRITDLNIATNIRKNEDILISKELYIWIINLDFLEALLRNIKKEDLFFDNLDISNFHKIKNDIFIKLKSTIDINDVLYFPAWYWWHIDHIITRFVWQELMLSWYNVKFYQELPYANRSVKINFANNFLKKFQLLEVNINNIIINKHLELVKIYKSQVLSRHLIEIKKFLESNKCYKIWE
jgi:hypothetical protein